MSFSIKTFKIDANKPFPAGPSTIMAVVSSFSALLMDTVYSTPFTASVDISNFLSFVSESMRSKLQSPSEQPIITPMTLPSSPVRFTSARDIWSPSKPGEDRPNFRAVASIIPPKETPATSLQIWPHAAAAMVLRPNVTPRVKSMAFPAWIITVLSMNPKPIIGTILCTKWARICSGVGRSSLASAWTPEHARFCARLMANGREARIRFLQRKLLRLSKAIKLFDVQRTGSVDFPCSGCRQQ
mmetsp:Transcript_17042/g.33296  ORF Transcript_17042/g.33296 Transcript_17042/m.33296 type:complete len:242 (-) Transcript_17042:28-753(-)